MKRMHLLSMAFACAGALALPAVAQTHPTGPAKNYDRSLYEMLSGDKSTVFEQLGGRPVLLQVMDDAVETFIADPRIKHHFAKTDVERLKLMLFEQVCNVSGGPCQYKGRDMADVHKGLKITEADFVALVEDLQGALRKNGVSFEVENKLLALLAPMRRVSVNQ